MAGSASGPVMRSFPARKNGIFGGNPRMAGPMLPKRRPRPPLRSRKPRCSRAGIVTVMPSGIDMDALLKRSVPCFLDIHFGGLFENLYQLTMRHTRAGWQSGQARLLEVVP